MWKLFLLSLLFAAVAGQMTQKFRDNLLRDHNDKRRQARNGANMIELRYDMALEQVAQAYLNRGCSAGFSHNPNRGCQYKSYGGTNGGTGTCGSVGENWYSGAPDNQTGTDVAIGGAVAQWTDGTCSSWASPPLRCASRWCSEKQNFYQTGSDSYGSCNQNSGQSLHYTQAMWATTTHVGCGYTAACGTLCNYAPAGNMNLPSMGSMREANVWKIGTPCSACPTGYTTCNNGLCAAGGGGGATTCPADTNKPTNGNVGTCGSSVAVGSSCTQVCNSGYTLTSGSLTRQCGTTGALSAVTAVCSAVTCPADTTTKPTNGNPGTCNVARGYGLTCTMACNTGYVLTSGSLVRTCGSTGGYGSSTAVCSAVTCPADSTKPTYGDSGTCGTAKTYGQTCTMTCNSGYRLASGSLVRTCGSNGQFSTSNAVCTASTTPATSAPTSAPTQAPTQAPTTAAPTTAAPVITQPPTAPTGYCSSGPTDNVDTEFGLVQVIGHASQIYDNNGCPGGIGVTDMSASMRVTVAQSRTYSINFDRSTCGDYYPAIATAWVDWNQNKVWEASEQLFPFTGVYGMNRLTFAVPSTAKLGTTRMRVQIQETEGTSISPCTMFDWGDTKDYTVTVIASTPQVSCAGDVMITPTNGNAGECLSTKSYGQYCSQRCNTGYELTSGSLDSMCGANGSYAPSTAVCSAATASLDAAGLEATPEVAATPTAVPATP